MSELLPPWPTLSAFIGASLVLALTPGPGVFYVVSRSLLQGQRSGLVSVLGPVLGLLFVLLAIVTDGLYALARRRWPACWPAATQAASAGDSAADCSSGLACSLRCLGRAARSSPRRPGAR